MSLGCSAILPLGMLWFINHPITVDIVTLWLLMVKCYRWPLVLQGLLIPIAINEPNSVTTSPAFNPGLQRRATMNFMGVLGPLSPTHFYQTPLVNGIFFGPSWETYLFWPHVTYPFQHSHFPEFFIPFLFCIPWQFKHFNSGSGRLIAFSRFLGVTLMASFQHPLGS